MSVKYRIVAKHNPASNDGEKYYAIPTPRDVVSFEELMERTVSNHGNLRKIDILYLVKCIADETIKLLADGKIVRLNDLGSLHLSFTSEGKDTPGEVRRSVIKNPKIKYTASPSFKETLQTLQFDKVK